ncbi:uncharacterized protein [Branchiostoma lanceolatum]|uniref:uncharacterized protein n=1 Tax=Branchiostoma lanceolatum TaxID=7740 RepID=UPI00345294EC
MHRKRFIRLGLVQMGLSLVGSCMGLGAVSVGVHQMLGGFYRVFFVLTVASFLLGQLLYCTAFLASNMNKQTAAARRKARQFYVAVSVFSMLATITCAVCSLVGFFTGKEVEYQDGLYLERRISGGAMAMFLATEAVAFLNATGAFVGALLVSRDVCLSVPPEGEGDTEERRQFTRSSSERSSTEMTPRVVQARFQAVPTLRRSNNGAFTLQGAYRVCRLPGNQLTLMPEESYLPAELAEYEMMPSPWSYPPRRGEAPPSYHSRVDYYENGTDTASVRTPLRRSNAPSEIDIDL